MNKKETHGRNCFIDGMEMNAKAQHVLASLFCTAANAGFDGDDEGGTTMRDGFAHLMRLLQAEREAVASELFSEAA